MMDNSRCSNIARARKERGLTQVELAKRLNLSVSLVRKAEYGNRIGAESLWQIAEYLELSVWDCVPPLPKRPARCMDDESYLEYRQRMRGYWSRLKYYDHLAVLEPLSLNALPEHTLPPQRWVQACDDSIDMTAMRVIMADILSKLSPRYREIIMQRYGFDGSSGRTLEEVGLLHNVTRDRIRQIEQYALRQLRHPLRSERLSPFLHLIHKGG